MFSSQTNFFCQKMVTHHIWNDLWNSVNFSKLTVNHKEVFIISHLFAWQEVVDPSNSLFFSTMGLLWIFIAAGSSLSHLEARSPMSLWSTWSLAHCCTAESSCWVSLSGLSCRHCWNFPDINCLFFFLKKIAIYIHTSNLQILWVKKRFNTFLS